MTHDNVCSEDNHSALVVLYIQVQSSLVEYSPTGTDASTSQIESNNCKLIR